ncbi:DnaJ domain-containing protein/DUF3444 domain-containing protein [Cephalotus follicularis]|uniref:DnaJ domain-containing protein/DUF3444 domain-containing protein n=1 Tax=Cephalotus follicularis TaxID=3775 RepID=A0A1Q3B831_CEPFO|nr:DnaJ domain-containing protein/DUF3444 domain-containing protein [Cephalotus follicularis]
MECNKEEAFRAKEIAERKMQMGDYSGAMKIALKAQRLFPDVENISQLLAVCEVHCSAETKLSGSEMDWYGILQIERFADEVIIKKQYRKLALLLHPDKNKFAGAEAAFKLIGEANRVLTDQTKRSAYDMKCRAAMRTTAPKPPIHQSNRNSSIKKPYGVPHNVPIAPRNNFPSTSRPQSTGSHIFQEAKLPTFWTICKNCGIRYQYYREFVNRDLRCQNCQKTFTAHDLGIHGVPPGYARTQFPSPKEVPNQGPFKVVSQSNDEKSTGTKFTGLHPMPEGGSAAGVGVGSKSEEKVGGKEGDGVRKPDATKAGRSGISSNAGKNRKRKSAEQSRKSCETGSSDYGEENDGDVSGSNSGLNGGHQARRSSRQKQRVIYKEKLSDDDDSVSHPKRSKGNESSSAYEERLKDSAVDDGVSKDANLAGSAAVGDTCKKGVKRKASAPLEGSLLKEDIRLGERETKKEEAAVYNHNDKKSKVEGDSDLCSSFGPDPKTLEYPEPEFNDFDKNRAENCFAVNQVWAVYDTLDGMPRFYAKVKRIISPGFKLGITWLEANPDDQGELDWSGVELPVASGKFSLGVSEATEDLLMFSHQMNNTQRNARCAYFIYPSEGETWALFRNWDIKWSSNPEKHKPPYQYEFVEVLSYFNANTGIEVTYLSKVKGFVALFQRIERQGIVSPSELYRFSHQVPSFRMTGKERKGVPVGSFELDPAALPTSIFGPLDPDEYVKMENANPANEENNSSANNLKSKVKPVVLGLATIGAPGLATIGTPKAKKRERSDPECVNPDTKRFLRESEGTHKNQSHVDTSQCANNVVSSKDISHGNLTQPKGSTTKCQAGASSNTPKKHENNDLATNALNLRRSPRDSNKKDSDLNVSRGTTKVVTCKPTDASKEVIRDSLEQFEGGFPTCQSGNDMKSPAVSPSMYAGCKILEFECYDFKKKKSEEKFQLGHIWALYSDGDGMPKDYAQVKKIESSKGFRLHIARLKSCSQSKDTIHPICCGKFKVENSDTKVVSPSVFSHRLRAEPVGKDRFEIRPREGEVWAVYKQRSSGSTCEHDIVLVLGENGESTEVVVLTCLTINGSKSLYKAPRIQRSKIGVINIPRAELARFSHQIPAIEHNGEKDTAMRGYWELDPKAVPGVVICLD